MSRKVILTMIVMTIFSFGISGNTAVYAGAEEYIGEISMFAGNFAPRGWAFCQGQLLSIQQNTALFSILGTTYGGDGVTTFALPDLRGRSPIGTGQGPGMNLYDLGQTGGTETATALTTQMLAHSHALNASTEAGTTNTPGTGTYLGKAVTPDRQEVNLYTTTAPNTTIGPASIGIAGGSQPQSIRDPYLAINYIICLQGIFPSRE
ncbi:MAG: microcystin-dependent protein [Bacillota bacterium]|nr:microcystin-dependent protein [Bacillota bacterium]